MKFLTRLTLGKKIALMASVGLLVGIGVFSFLGIRAVSQAVDTMLQDRLTLARLTADYIDDTLSRILAELTDIAQTIDDASFRINPEPHIERLEIIASRLSIYINAMYLMNSNGEILWSKPEIASSTQINISVYPSIGQALSSGNTTVSGLMPSPLTRVPAVLLTGPGPAKQSALVVAIDVARSSIGGFVQPVRLGETGYVEIVDQNGIVVARTEPGPELAPFEISDHSGRFAALIAADKPTRGVCHSCHQPVQRVERRDVLAFAPLSEARWGVVIRQSENEAFAPIRELRLNLIFAGAGLVIIASVFMTVTTRDVVSRIWMLTTASKRIAQGDLVTPITLAREDELGVLAQTLDDMRTRLRTSYEQLEQRTKELSSLLSVSEILASQPTLANLEATLTSALDKTLEIMKVNTGGILLWDEEKQAFCYRAYRGLSQEYVEGMYCRPGEGIAGKVAQSGEAIVVEDISTNPRAIHHDLIATEGLRAFASVPLRSKDRVLGVLNITSREARQFSAQDVRLLESIGGQIATALENVRLHQEVQHKDEIRGELLREILSIQEEERRRIARELHDETSQVLASLTANLEAIASILPASAEKATAIIRKSQALSVKILDEIHRLIYELRPSLLDDLGLVAATRWLIDNNLVTIGVKVDFKTVGRVRRLPPQLEATLFRVIQEAVSNIARHAHAKNAELTLHFQKKMVAIHISDDGHGFDVEEAINAKDRPRGLGLLGMKERVELMRGTLNIHSQPDRGGTEIDVKIPLSEEDSDGQNKGTGG